jgi:hypothetical protein
MRGRWRRLNRHGRIHMVLTFVWIVIAPFAVLTGLKESVPFLVAVSVYANIVGHWSSYEASTPTEESPPAAA